MKAEVVCECDECGQDVLEDNFYYDVFGVNVCEDCMDNFKKVARIVEVEL